MPVRGLTTRHEAPLIETRFATDPLEWTERKARLPAYIRIPIAFVLSGFGWAVILVLLIEVAALVNR
jgi:hypothetical protein